MSTDPTSIRIPAGEVALDGDLTLPVRARGIVVFAHGSGSSRFSPRNRHVAAGLVAGGLATVLIDLLSPAEEQVDLRTRALRFDIGLLARRLAAVADWLDGQPSLQALPIGYFGASTGGGAALMAAAQRPERVAAVVSRGGRPDLAGAASLARVQAPTLLIVGGDDTVVIELNKQAQQQMSAPTRLAIVAGAGHLFEEAGTLDEVTRLARDWFVGHFTTSRGAP